MKIIEIAVPQYQIESEPDYKIIGKLVDDELRKHFMDQTIVARGVGSSEHNGRPYATAWQFVEEHDYKQIISQLRDWYAQR